ncbi:hypothetical protein LF1_09000 [Rubripirellula obstinata]|uniref:Uncharacterized protein n=1 Tax=Rubripirellula obstinata TaxID=406547 RepID=A0A5B1CDU4_9BACT|nr:hypothetical protein LF1_09000 [Rubripirellula obstinata]
MPSLPSAAPPGVQSVIQRAGIVPGVRRHPAAEETPIAFGVGVLIRRDYSFDPRPPLENIVIQSREPWITLATSMPPGIG